MTNISKSLNINTQRT